MSGSFWKFGRDYSSESQFSRILNRAFIKNEDKEGITGEIIYGETEHSSSDSDMERDDEDRPDVQLPEDEEGFKDYVPNLNVLSELLDDEELYTELMCSNFKLLMYLKYPTVLSRLIDYVIVDHTTTHEGENADDSDEEDEEMITDDQHVDTMREGSDSDIRSSDLDADPLTETEDQIEVRRAQMAAEVLSADIWSISSAIIDSPELLEKLWSVTNNMGVIAIDISTYFMKINERLLDMDMNGMIKFIVSQDDLVDKFIAHIDDPPLIDFLLKVISTDKPDSPNGIIQELKSQALIPKLIDLLSPENDASLQCASADFLKALIAISGNCIDEVSSGIGPNELTRQLASTEIMERVVMIMLNGGTSLSNGVGIIIELIRKNNSDYDFVQVMYTTLETHPPNDRDPIYLGFMLRLFAKHMADFNNILIETTLPILETSFGRVEPLGFERFKICELVAELLHCSNMSLLNERRGEAIILERDAARQRLLSEKETALSNESFNEIPVPSEGEDVTNKLNSLQLEGSQAGSPAETGRNFIEGEEFTGADEDISDSDEMERSLCNDPVVGDLLKISLLNTQIITTILEMFFHFVWNNFLHNVVFDIVQQIFNGPLKTGYNRFLLKNLLDEAEITKLIIEGEKESLKEERENNLRLGYMGHLTLISEEIVKFAAYIDEMKISFTTSTIHNRLNENEWKEYVETTLTETREKYDLVLGETINDGDEEEEENEYDDVDYGFEEMFAKNSQAEEEGEEEEADDVNHSKYDVGNQEKEEGDDFNGYSHSQIDGYYEYIDSNGSKTMLYSSTIEYNNAESEAYNEYDDGDEENDENFGAYISTQPSSSFKDSDRRPKRHSENGKAIDSDEDEDDWDSAPESFLLNTVRRNNGNASGDLHDVKVFQHQFALESLENDDRGGDSGDQETPYAHLVYSSNPTSHYAGSKSDEYATILSHKGDDDDGDDDEEEEEEVEEEEEEEEEEEDKMSDNSDDDSSDEERNTVSPKYKLCRTTSKENLSWDDDDDYDDEQLVGRSEGKQTSH
ncbi:hypothetical protein KAFR_0A01390 [Kazachstania africana CBS 2517]|uniref:Uncharacterized protein n=1 Tax=Kazachstania africana (strain ATCC 22294 / BCRC 22015 / CBS 2517 / CECT 1963 / NBRC 1671 / NRRL Y-8276) TaxID=1071382 RepID=H2AMH7_KAZAF|nr:hypothetical protein KAFR_0A01390 [Kazachstania africana CBS 2517]CCF55577.1 hypothetical protein KAFR_0A01390 [Kazachstania africana CBS 2517]